MEPHPDPPIRPPLPITRTFSSLERSLRAEFQQVLAERDAQLENQLESLKRTLEDRAYQFIQDQMASIVAGHHANGEDENERPKKKLKGAQAGVLDEGGRKCFVCHGSGNGRDVHRNRELGLDLDGKCRKQVETFRQGGIITERREEWKAALESTSCQSELGSKLLGFLGHKDGAGPSRVSNQFRMPSPALAPVPTPAGQASGDCGRCSYPSQVVGVADPVAIEQLCKMVRSWLPHPK